VAEGERGGTSTTPPAADAEHGGGADVAGGDGKRLRGKDWWVEARRRTEEARVRLDDARARLEGSRPRSKWVDLAFGVYERDRASFGSLLSGALAYRLFIFLVPFLLLVVAVLGFMIDVDASSPTTLGQSLGLNRALSTALTDTARQAESGRWLALFIGLFGSLWAARSAGRAVRLVHAAVWGVLPAPVRASRVAGGFMLAAVIALGLPVLTSWLRERSPVGGILFSIVVIAIYGGIWLLASLAPGALLVGVGADALHVFTVYYLANRADRAASIYGAIGIAVVILLWLFLTARIIVASAVLNAELFRRREAAQERRRRATGE
jgi:uncharacterized BrkB/YihY/UPF0761 family membrane protein